MSKYLRYAAPLIAATLLGAVAVLGITAKASSPTDQIRGCVYNGFLLGLGTGALRIVTAGTACNANETALAWNQTGLSFAGTGARAVTGPDTVIPPGVFTGTPVTVTCQPTETPLSGAWQLLTISGVGSPGKVTTGQTAYTPTTYTAWLTNANAVPATVHATAECLTTS